MNSRILILSFFLIYFSPPKIVQAFTKDKKSDRPEVDKEYIEDIKKDWKFIYEKDRISIFKKEFKDSPITAFRGVGILPIPMDVLFHIIRNIDKSHEWTPNLAYKRMAKSDSLVEGTTYNMNTLPWPATDRETLLYSKLFYNEATKFFIVTTKSVELSEYPPSKEFVRGIVYESSFQFRPVPGGTLLDLDAHIDPKGDLPSWLINFIQVEWAYKFLTSLEKYAKKGHFKPEEPFTKMMNAYLKHENIQEIFDKIKNPNMSTKSNKSRNKLYLK